MIITITGLPGSGKSTLGKPLADALGMEYHYMGNIVRTCAKRRGMTLNEYLKLGETDASIDREVDAYQIELGKHSDNFVIEGRPSFYLIPHSVKVFLTVSLAEGARRIKGDLDDKEKAQIRNEGVSGSEEAIIQRVKERIASDRRRFKKYYGIPDAYDPACFDIVVDTTDKTPEATLQVVLQKIRDMHA